MDSSFQTFVTTPVDGKDFTDAQRSQLESQGYSEETHGPLKRCHAGDYEDSAIWVAALKPSSSRPSSNVESDAASDDVQQEDKDTDRGILKLMNALHQDAVKAKHNDEHHKLKILKVVIDLLYFSGQGRTAYRFLSDPGRKGVTANAKAARDDAHCSDEMRELIDAAIPLLDALKPCVYSEQEWQKLRTAFKESAHGLESLRDDLMRLLLNPDAVDQKQAVITLQKVEKLQACIASPHLKLHCLSLAMNIKMQRDFVLQPSGITADFVTEFRKQQRARGVLGLKLQDRVEESHQESQYAEEMSNDDDDDDLVEMNEYSTKLVAFESPSAAESFINSICRQPQIADDDVDWVCDNQKRCAERILTAFFTTESLPPHGQRSEAQQKKAEAQKRWRQLLGHIDAQEARKIVTALSHMLVKYIIEYHLEGDNLFKYFMRRCTKADEQMKARERFETLEFAILTEKNICVDLLKKPGAHALKVFLAQPIQYVKDKKAHGDNNYRKKRRQIELRKKASSTSSSVSGSPSSTNVTPSTPNEPETSKKPGKGRAGSNAKQTEPAKDNNKSQNAAISARPATPSTSKTLKSHDDEARATPKTKRLELKVPTQQNSTQSSNPTAQSGAVALNNAASGTAATPKSSLPATDFTQLIGKAGKKRFIDEDEDDSVEETTTPTKRRKPAQASRPLQPDEASARTKPNGATSQLPSSDYSIGSQVCSQTYSAEQSTPKLRAPAFIDFNQPLGQSSIPTSGTQQDQLPAQRYGHEATEDDWQDAAAYASQAPTNDWNFNFSLPGAEEYSNADDIGGQPSKSENTAQPLPGIIDLSRDSPEAATEENSNLAQVGSQFEEYSGATNNNFLHPQFGMLIDHETGMPMNFNQYGQQLDPEGHDVDLNFNEADFVTNNNFGFEGFPADAGAQQGHEDFNDWSLFDPVDGDLGVQ